MESSPGKNCQQTHRNISAEMDIRVNTQHFLRESWLHPGWTQMLNFGDILTILQRVKKAKAQESLVSPKRPAPIFVSKSPSAVMKVA